MPGWLLPVMFNLEVQAGVAEVVAGVPLPCPLVQGKDAFELPN